MSTVSNVKKRYLEGGLEYGLCEHLRLGAAPKSTGEVDAHLIALAYGDLPEGQARWTLRLSVDKLNYLELVKTISHVEM